LIETAKLHVTYMRLGIFSSESVRKQIIAVSFLL
jgi:hypothetical protein